MQELALGKPSSLADMRRGDLIFWKGHVAIARDAETILHANAHAMMVAIEPADAAIARIKAAGSDGHQRETDLARLAANDSGAALYRLDNRCQRFATGVADDHNTFDDKAGVA